MQKIKKKVSGLSNLKSSYGRILSFAGKSPPKPIIGTNAYSKGDNTDLESILGEKGFARYFSEEGKTEETTELTIGRPPVSLHSVTYLHGRYSGMGKDGA